MFQKYSQMDYQTIRPMTKPTQKQRTFTRNNFAELNYNYVNRPQTTKPSRANTQNHKFSQKVIFQQPSSNSVNLMITHEFYKSEVKIIHFFSKIKIIDSKTELDIKYLITHLIIFHQMMKIIITKIINNFIKIKDSTLTT